MKFRVIDNRTTKCSAVWEGEWFEAENKEEAKEKALYEFNCLSKHDQNSVAEWGVECEDGDYLIIKASRK